MSGSFSNQAAALDLHGGRRRCRRMRSSDVLRVIERGELAAVRLGPRGHHRVYVDGLNGWMRPAGEAQEPRT
jgi:hypothetical protein